MTYDVNMVGPNLRAKRLEMGLTQEKFGKVLGISGGMVKQYEGCWKLPSLAAAIYFASVLGMTMDELTGCPK